MTRLVMGIDAAANAWLAVVLVDGVFEEADFQPSLAALLSRHPAAEAIAVDIPIGLPSGRMRSADYIAKRFVGGARASTVFPTFPVEVLAAKPYEAAVAEARRVVHRGISRQSYQLRERIFEAASVAAKDLRLVEAHPEVSFRAMAGAPLAYSKHSWNGIWERRLLLRNAGIELPEKLPGGRRAAPDDVVDAAAAAWTASRVAVGVARTLSDPSSNDASAGGVINY